MTVENHIVMIEGATTAMESIEYTNNKCETLYLEFSGTGTFSASLMVKSTPQSVDYTPIAGINFKDYSTVAEGITEAGIYLFPIDCAYKFKVSIDEITDGDVSVNGKLIREV